MLVPVGVIAQAAGVATYPFLARLAAEGRLKDLSAAIVRALKPVVLLSLVAAAGLMALSVPVVRVLYERGEFGGADTLATAGTVVFFALGVPLWGVQQILARSFYAREQMWAPVVIGTLATVAAVPIYWGLQEAMGVNGLALASTLSILVYTIGLAVVWYGRMGWEWARPVAASAARGLPVAAAAGFAAWGAAAWVLPAGGAGQWRSLLAALVGGVVLLGVAALPPWTRRDLHS
jgi:putative peptidoglycan lipid II flippase